MNVGRIDKINSTGGYSNFGRSGQKVKYFGIITPLAKLISAGGGTPNDKSGPKRC